MSKRSFALPDLDEPKSRVLRGKGRPKLDAQLDTKVMHVRVSSSEKDAIDATAKELGVSTSELIRRLLREASGHGPSYFEDGIDRIEDLLTSVRSIGRKMNVIASGVNQNQVDIDGPTRDEIQIVLKQLYQIKLQLGRTAKQARSKIVKRSK